VTDKPRVLVIDDGLAYAEIIEKKMPEFELVRPDGPSSRPCLADGPSALAFLGRARDKVDLALLDMNFDVPDDRLLSLGENASPKRVRRFQGVAILREIRKRHPDLPVVLLTAVEDLSLVDDKGELASQPMTYFLDGDDLDALRIRINTALKQREQSSEEAEILWGEDPSMRTVRRRLSVLASGTMPVILSGETGTGKSFLAKHLIWAKSGRTGPFVVLDLASIPRDLAPAHLFGVKRGAYTGAVADRKGVFEMAHKGVLFIDEVQNIPLEAQKQLLIVLQERRVMPLGSVEETEVDVKVVAATSSFLEREVAQGRFRSDLYMRLSPTTRVMIPPLRQRPGDLLFLARRFTARAASDSDIAGLLGRVSSALGLGENASLGLIIGRQKSGGDAEIALEIPKPVWNLMEEYGWPGNMRELETVMRNIAVFTLVAAVDAVESGLQSNSKKLQVDPGLVAELLTASAGPVSFEGLDQASTNDDAAPLSIPVTIEPQRSLNSVANSVERQYFISLFRKTKGDFSSMAGLLLGDPAKGRAVRLRFNQLGLKVKEYSSK
jgi:DNA-binding NtrC family response regulator